MDQNWTPYLTPSIDMLPMELQHAGGHHSHRAPSSTKNLWRTHNSSLEPPSCLQTEIWTKGLPNTKRQSTKPWWRIPNVKEKHTFNSALDGGAWSASRSYLFKLREIAPSNESPEQRRKERCLLFSRVKPTLCCPTCMTVRQPHSHDQSSATNFGV
jgi:hypothetical protein